MFKPLAFLTALSLFISAGLSHAQVTFTKSVIDSVFPSFGRPWDIQLADFNGDGELDLIVSVYDAGGTNDVLYGYWNDGNEGFTRSVIDTTTDNTTRMDTADLDGDMDNDLVLASQDEISWYRNDGGGNLSKISIDSGLSAPRIPLAVDLDGDADLDIVVLANGGIFWEVNDGNQVFARDTVDATAIVDFGLAVTDLDGDLDLDVVSVIYGVDADDILLWYPNDGNENFVRDTIDVFQRYIADLEVEDLDDDGDRDLVLSELEENTISWYRNDGNESFSRNTVDTDFNQFPACVSVADIDGDGDKDIIAAGGNSGIGEVVYYENDGEENFARRVIDDTGGNRNRLAAADIDDDGDIDLFATNNFPFEVVFYRNEGPTGATGERAPEGPRGFALEQNHPNPFNPMTTIRFDVPASSSDRVDVALDIYDLRGRRVRSLVHERMSPGLHLVSWDGKTDDGEMTASGFYLYRLAAAGTVETRRMVLSK